jgi:hypothetical protein
LAARRFESVPAAEAARVRDKHQLGEAELEALRLEAVALLTGCGAEETRRGQASAGAAALRAAAVARCEIPASAPRRTASSSTLRRAGHLPFASQAREGPQSEAALYSYLVVGFGRVVASEKEAPIL